MTKKTIVVLIAVFMILSLLVPAAQAKDGKMGYVDLRKAFYEYEKTKTMESQLTDETESRQTERTKMIEKINKIRDEVELLSGKAKTSKQAEIDNGLAALQEFDRETRQTLLNKKNDMFREVIEDIQKVVETIGEKDGYDYVMDSRNIMYAKPEFDLTERVIKELNK
ncbi:MAG: OmpH family outer membrane protein [Candidatus Omnitrophota bacterium]